MRPVIRREPLRIATRIVRTAPLVRESSDLARRDDLVWPRSTDAVWSVGEPRTDPCPDYRIVLTDDGGIRIVFKAFDDRLRHALASYGLWLLATGIATWLCLWTSPVHTLWVNLFALLFAIVAAWLIITTRMEIYRTLALYRDCMVLDDDATFFVAQMENGWPSFRPSPDGSFVLSGTYGTRFVEYLTVPRFDENDRSPEVMQAHLKWAMQQLWTRPWS